MIFFKNPGEIDIRLVTTLGVNVKENDSAIGFHAKEIGRASCRERVSSPV